MLKHMKLHHKIIYAFTTAIVFFLVTAIILMYDLCTTLIKCKEVIQLTDLFAREQAVQHLQSQVTTELWVGVGLVALFVVVFGNIAWFIARNFKKHVAGLSAAVAQLNEGNFDIQLWSKDSCELGELTRDLQGFIVNLDEVVHELIHTV